MPFIIGIHRGVMEIYHKKGIGEMAKNFISLLSSVIVSVSSCHAEGNFTLITMLYNETNDERIVEYLTCLDQNLKHPDMKQIHVVYDTSKDNAQNRILDYLKQQNLIITYVTGRETYDFCFKLANELYANSVVIVSNADIYFNETLHLLIDYDLTNKFLALTRWNVTRDGSLAIYYWKDGRKAERSQDTWIFKTPLRQFDDPTVQIGVPHCDGRIAYEAQKSGLTVLNPCLTIQCCHLHLSGLHNYTAAPFPHGRAIAVPWCVLE
jgi:hypothetical protein